MKKLLCALLATSMIGTCGAFVSAADTNVTVNQNIGNGLSGDVTFLYEVTSKWTVTIPKTNKLDDKFEITATGLIESTNNLVVTHKDASSTLTLAGTKVSANTIAGTFCRIAASGTADIAADGVTGGIVAKFENADNPTDSSTAMKETLAPTKPKIVLATVKSDKDKLPADTYSATTTFTITNATKGA